MNVRGFTAQVEMTPDPAYMYLLAQIRFRCNFAMQSRTQNPTVRRYQLVDDIDESY